MAQYASTARAVTIVGNVSESRLVRPILERLDDGFALDITRRGTLPEGFELARTGPSPSALGLVKALLPRRGATRVHGLKSACDRARPTTATTRSCSPASAVRSWHCSTCG